MDQFNKRVWIDSRRHWQSTLYVNIHINMKPKIISSDLKSNSIFHFISTLWAAVIMFGHVSKAFCSFYTHEDQVQKRREIPLCYVPCLFCQMQFSVWWRKVFGDRKQKEICIFILLFFFCNAYLVLSLLKVFLHKLPLQNISK